MLVLPIKTNPLVAFPPSMSSVVTIDLSAYAKIFLHAAKYPYFPVIGLLAGSNEREVSNGGGNCN